MPTPHNRGEKGDFAKTVLMPGDPLRAKFIAEHFLENARLVNDVRAAYGYTGSYKGKTVSVMASGMGMPSMGIYSYELFRLYDVENIIRIGSSGSYVPELNLYDVVIAESVWSESSFAKTQNGSIRDILYPSKDLNRKIKEAAEKRGTPLIPVRVHSSDVFYPEADMDDYQKIHKKHQCDCVDMESFALFHNADVLQKHAACLLTISDSFPTGEKASAKERQEAFTVMIEIALDAC